MPIVKKIRVAEYSFGGSDIDLALATIVGSFCVNLVSKGFINVIEGSGKLCFEYILKKVVQF